MEFNYNYEAVDMGDEIICVPIGENASQLHGVLRMNQAALEIMNLLKKNHTKEKTAAILTEKYDDDPESIISYIDEVVYTLENIGFLKTGIL